MGTAGPGTLIGRDKQLSYVDDMRRRLRNAGVECVWVTGQSGSGKSLFLEACMEKARRTGWEVLYGQCNEDTRADPYGPFLTMLGLCFDKAGRLINDRSVYSIVDQISFDAVMDAVADIPGLAVVALGIRVGKSIFESRRTPRPEDELLNRNFEFILQVIKQVDIKRQRPVFMAIDDLHLASPTTYALLSYLLTRLQDARLLVVATWNAPSFEEAGSQIHNAFSGRGQFGQFLELPELSNEQMRRLLDVFRHHQPLDEMLAMTMIRFSRGLPGILRESMRLVELEDRSGQSAGTDLGERLSLAPIAAEEVECGLVVLTHEHTDHLDPDTIPVIAAKNPECRFAAPAGCEDELKAAGVSRDRWLLLEPRQDKRVGHVVIHTAQADHGDLAPTALAIVLDFDGVRVFLSGDTSWRPGLFQPLFDLAPDVVLPCINGVFGNMGHIDAAMLVRQAVPRFAIPCHFWTFAEQGGGDPAGFMHACLHYAPETKAMVLRPGEGFTVAHP